MARKRKSYYGRKVDTAAECIQDQRKDLNIVDPQGRPNPMYSQIQFLDDHADEFEAISQAINDIADEYRRGPLGVTCALDRVAFLHDERMLALEAQYCALMKASFEVPPSRGPMPPPVGRAEFYGDFESGEVTVDVGSGDAAAQKQLVEACTEVGISMVATDPITGTDALQAISENGDAVYCSRNALTQLPTDHLENLVEHDGLHAYPDVEQLADLGIVDQIQVPEHNGPTHKYVDKNENVWEDRVVNLPSRILKFGYRGANTFRRRRISLSFDGVWHGAPPGFEPFDTFTRPDLNNVPSGDVSPKIDGVMARLQIERAGGRAILVKRNGEFQIGTATGDLPSRASLHVEMVGLGEALGSDMLFVLRVEQWRNYKPYHSGPLLRHFSKRVAIDFSIGDHKTRAVAPPEHRGEREHFLNGHLIPSDGLIYRTATKDYYRKTRWTSDIDDVGAVRTYFEERGWKVGFTTESQPGLNEYECSSQEEGKVRFIWVRGRPDKTTGATPQQVFDFALRLARDRTLAMPDKHSDIN